MTRSRLQRALSRSRLRRGMAVCLLAPVAALSVAGCTSVRNGLGTRDGLCFSSLPAARAAVGSTPQFAGVRYLPPQSLVTSVDRSLHRDVRAPAKLTAAMGKGACLVAFRGSVPDRVSDVAWDPEPGAERFTVVLVRQSNHQVIGIVELPNPPLRFDHL